MAEFKIEDDIPISPVTRPRAPSFWDRLRVGQSVLADARAAKAAYQFGRNHGKQFTARAVEGGVRVWRGL